MEIISVLPGKTVGGIYLSAYEANSTLSYHELIVVPALVRYRQQIGTWISHIYVDHPASVLGGRKIWGLPKELAEFSWGDRQVSVRQGSTLLCQIQYSQSGLPLSIGGKSKISGIVFSGLDQDVLSFKGEFETRLKWIGAKIMIPAESPFSTLDLGRSWLTLQFCDVHLTANAPAVVGQWTPEFSHSSATSE